MPRSDYTRPAILDQPVQLALSQGYYIQRILAHDDDAGAPMPMWALMRQGFIVSIRRQPGRVIDDLALQLKD